MAAVQHAGVKVIVNEQGGKNTAFSIAYTVTELMVGDAAKN